MNYTHLTQAERYQIAILSKAGHEQSEIARVMNRHPSTMSRELRRNRGQRGYRPKQAHEFSKARMRACANGPRISDETWVLVEERLGELWSPEQICGRLKACGLPAASHEAIYQRIYADKRNGGTLHRALRCQKARRKRYRGRERRGTIPNQVSIEQRPAIANSRRRFGDWEGDLVIGAGQHQALVTLNERKSKHLGLPVGSVKVYVLVEQIEACFQLMEIRAALGAHFIGFNTGRWDYINSVSDALAWDPAFVDPNIDAITMTYGYMRVYEDRVRRAVNTPDRNGRFALWQGGMEPNIPVGSAAGVFAGMKRAMAGAEREEREGASGKWVAHWKMVHIVRPVWEQAGRANQLGRQFPPLTYTAADADGLTLLEPAPRTIRGARDLMSVALQYGNAFGQGLQAAALKPADFFGNDDVLYLMEDMATGEIRLSILWEWLHKNAMLTEDDPETGAKAGDTFSRELCMRVLAEEYSKLLKADNRDVYDSSKATTLPIAREIIETYLTDANKLPWYIDLLNITLDNHDLGEAKRRIEMVAEAFDRDGTRITVSDTVPESAYSEEFRAK